jgi:hypothetical protein
MGRLCFSLAKNPAPGNPLGV